MSSPLARTARYFKAYSGIGELNRRTDSLIDRPYELLAEMDKYCGGFLYAFQVPEEIVPLLEDVRTLKPQTVLEIGTHRGGTLYLWARMAQPDAILISIDLPGGKFGGGYSPFRTPIYRRFGQERQKLHLMRANSHHPSTLEETKRLLSGRPIDLLFIDGDHTYEGVKKDWEMYSPLVRSGGLIVFHDVAGNYEDTQVKAFWDEAKINHPYKEYMTHPEKLYGIGVLQK
jgi:predicted O-methyltransferase YrrM